MPPSERLHLLNQWLSSHFNENATPELVAGDASFRRYYRMFPERSANLALGKSWILMDAPPTHEDCRPFLAVRDLLSQAGQRVPTLIAQNLPEGFLALEDFGDTTFSMALDGATITQQELYYRGLLHEVVEMQRYTATTGLPLYDVTLLYREMSLFPEWYLRRYLQAPFAEDLLHQQCALISARVCRLPTAFTHRDYHSRNVMVLPATTTKAWATGLLDFQDALRGPLAYDVVSLLRDAYVDRDERLELDWLIRYWEAGRKAGLPLPAEFAEFYQDYEWVGLQRHLKVLGIFARLYLRDGKDRYLADLPRVFRHALKVCQRYRDLFPLAKLLESIEEKALGTISTTQGYTF
jgi:aminoglycoside/choline kinase family phosphotransferase